MALIDWNTFMKSIVWIARTTGFLSMIGTSFVMYEIAVDKKKRAGVYFRLLFVMCVIEFFDGLAFFLGTWATPADNFWWGSSGTHGSCMFQAFLLQASIGSSLYNASLALYYVLSIRYNWSERLISQKIEPWMHGISLTIAYGTAIASYFLGIYGSIGSVCYIGRYPPECKETYRYGYTDCERGDNASLYSIIFFEIWQYSAMVFTAGCMCLVWSMVRNQENRVARYTQNFERTNFSTDTIAANRPSTYGGNDRQQSIRSNERQSLRSDDDAAAAAAAAGTTGTGTTRSVMAASINRARKSIIGNANDRQSGIDRKYSKRFATQGLLYVLVFYLSHFFATLGLMMYHATGQWPQVVMIITNVFLPFEGFLNTMVYLRPRLLRMWRERQKRKENEKASGLQSELQSTTFMQSKISREFSQGDLNNSNHNSQAVSNGDNGNNNNNNNKPYTLRQEEKEQMSLDAY